MAKFCAGFNLVIVPDNISAEKLCNNFKKHNCIAYGEYIATKINENFFLLDEVIFDYVEKKRLINITKSITTSSKTYVTMVVIATLDTVKRSGILDYKKKDFKYKSIFVANSSNTLYYAYRESGYNHELGLSEYNLVISKAKSYLLSELLVIHDYITYCTDRVENTQMIYLVKATSNTDCLDIMNRILIKNRQNEYTSVDSAKRITSDLFFSKSDIIGTRKE